MLSWNILENIKRTVVGKLWVLLVVIIESGGGRSKERQGENRNKKGADGHHLGWANQ